MATGVDTSPSGEVISFSWFRNGGEAGCGTVKAAVEGWNRKSLLMIGDVFGIRPPVELWSTDIAIISVWCKFCGTRPSMSDDNCYVVLIG